MFFSRARRYAAENKALDEYISNLGKPDGNVFTVGPYLLDASISGLAGLTEFSQVQYASMGRHFVNEKDFNAPPLLFLDHTWDVMLQTVDGKICKIVISTIVNSKATATAIAERTRLYCYAKLGSPDQQPNLFSWRAHFGNAILQTSQSVEGLLISLFLTSNAVRDFGLL
jgi:hypothetical protein